MRTLALIVALFLLGTVFVVAVHGCGVDRHPCAEDVDPWAVAATFDSAYVVKMNGYWLCFPAGGNTEACHQLRTTPRWAKQDEDDGVHVSDADCRGTATPTATRRQ